MVVRESSRAERNAKLFAPSVEHRGLKSPLLRRRLLLGTSFTSKMKKRRDKNMNNIDRCIMCDEPITEGRQVCYTCEEKVINKEVFNMNNNENINQSTPTITEPADKVKYEVKGVFTKFSKTRDPKNSINDCRILASVEEGIVSISMAQEKGVMLTVRFDEMVELITEALNKAKELKAVDGGNENDGE